MSGHIALRDLLEGWTAPLKPNELPLRKYSTSGDILSYKRCRRQYGFFSVRGFTSTSSTFRYFGTLVHDVLDMVVRRYRSAGTLPDIRMLDGYVEIAHDRLIRSGIRPFHARQKSTATVLLARFIQLFGPAFFGHIQETEYRLERTLQTHLGRHYILEGVVDVLSASLSNSLGVVTKSNNSDTEIWDYKSGRMPEAGSQQLQDYHYQMHVYAELFFQQTGAYPARTVLVFIGELATKRNWEANKYTVLDFPRLIYPLHPEPEAIQAAISDFHHTVEEIEAERVADYVSQWQAPPLSHNVDKRVCTACELRFSCGYFCTKHDADGELRIAPL